MTNFNELGLPKELVTRVAEMGLKTPTPIQEKAIPLALAGRDVMGLAQTGTGKTYAFGLPLVAQMRAADKRPAPRAVHGLVTEDSG